MVSKKDYIKSKKEDLKKMQDSFNEVMTKLKNDSKEYNAEYIGEVSRRLMCFYFGEYQNFYDYNKLYSYKYKLDKSQCWSKDKGGFVNNNYYLIRDQLDNNIGFICEKSDIFDAIGSDKLFKIWNWYCAEKKYTKSLNDFLIDLKDTESKLNIFEIYIDFLYDTSERDHQYSHIFQIINEPSIKVKNMVLFIPNHKNLY